MNSTQRNLTYLSSSHSILSSEFDLRTFAEEYQTADEITIDHTLPDETYGYTDDYEISEHEISNETVDNIKQQLAQIRSSKHDEFICTEMMDGVEDTCNSIYRGLELFPEVKRDLFNSTPDFDLLHPASKEDKSEIIEWPKNTILIASDSIFNRIDE